MRENHRIVHILAPAREGGLERVVAMMSAGRPANSVHIAAVIEPGEANNHPFIDQLESLGIPFTPVVVGARNYFREYQLLGALVARIRPSIVHTHGYRADLVGGAVSRSYGVPTVSTVHGFTGGGIRNGLYEWLQLYGLKRADAVIAVSSPIAERLARDGIPGHKIHCVPNGFTSLVNTVARTTARQRLGLAPDALVAGWVGRLSKEKGADIMLDALAECDSKWRLSIIGGGEELIHLQRQAAALQVGSRITWHGPIANAGSLFTAFDAFVLSSRTEGTPIALFEAMNAGVPIVAACVGGVPDVVDASQALLVPSEDPIAIATALKELERDGSGAADRALRSGERLLQKFGLSAWLDAVDKVYDEASARKKGTRGKA